MRSLWVVAFVAVLTTSAFADDDHAQADKLFQEAQALKEAGKTAEACKKFEEAYAANKNAVGTLLNVAKCNEDSGKVATAVKLYTQARDLARENKLDEHRTAAEGRIEAVKGRVPHLAISFAERIPGMKLVIDDEVYPTDAESTSALPLDPGARHIVVTAPGRLPFSTDVTLTESKQQTLDVPQLDKPVTVKKTRRTMGKILTFTGMGLAVAGVVIGYFANQIYEAEFVAPAGEVPHCREASPKPMCNSDGAAATKNAKFLGWAGTVVGLTGVAAAGVGLVLWITAPSEPSERQVSIVPSLTTDSAGIAAVGRF